MFVKHFAPDSKKVQKSYFKHIAQSQGHKAINLGVIWKGIISRVCIPNMKSLSLTVKQLKRRLKLTTERQTDRKAAKQTDRQTGQKQYVPDHLIWDIKMKALSPRIKLMVEVKVVKK